MTPKNREILFLAIITLISAFLLFSNLGNRYMWQDEAQTSLIAKTVIDRGLPYGTDGRNFFSQDNGVEYGKDYLWKWHPWLQFYVLAPFIKAFGFSNFTARFPFALFALGSIFLVYFLVRELFLSANKAMLATIILAIYVPFLILGRQSRYYAPEMFFCLLVLYSYARFLAGKKGAGLLYAAALTFLFHTIYVYFFAAAGACAVHALVFKRGKAAAISLISAAALAVNIPFLLTIYHIDFMGVHPGMFDAARILRSIRDYAGYIAGELPCWWLLVLVPFYALFKFKFRMKLGIEGAEYAPAVMLPVFFAVSVIICMSVLAVIPFYRNLAGTIPVFAVIAALLIAPMFHARFYAGVFILGLFAATGQMPDYLYEITHNYDGPVKGMVKYLDKNAKDTDSVLITYGDMPLKLYTKLKIYGGLSGEPYAGIKPQWIILRKHIMDEREKLVVAYVRDRLDRKDYELDAINYPDNYDENSERPSKHAFWTDKKEDRVVIYKKIRE